MALKILQCSFRSSPNSRLITESFHEAKNLSILARELPSELLVVDLTALLRSTLFSVPSPTSSLFSMRSWPVQRNDQIAAHSNHSITSLKFSESESFRIIEIKISCAKDCKIFQPDPTAKILSVRDNSKVQPIKEALSSSGPDSKRRALSLSWLASAALMKQIKLAEYYLFYSITTPVENYIAKASIRMQQRCRSWKFLKQCPIPLQSAFCGDFYAS